MKLSHIYQSASFANLIYRYSEGLTARKYRGLPLMDFEKFTPTMIKTAKQGGNVAAILDAVERIEKIEGMVPTMALFRQAFNLYIHDVVRMEPWHRLNKNGRGISDEEIDKIMMPLIRKNLGMEDWNVS